ncbi:CT214 family putative inclusion membrane protein, partial [Chlamydia trachomatis]
SLLSLNIFFSGWCLGNPEYNQYITTAVAEKYKDVSVRNRIYDFLDTGNVISALALASSYSQDSAWAAGLQKVLREEDKKTKKKSREEVSCLYRDIDPGCCLRALPKRFESKSSGSQGSPKEQLSSLLKALDQKIPSGVLGLIAKASSADLKADFAGMLEVIKQLQALFDSYPPLCEDNILLWLSASLEQVGLQKKLRTFLPSSEKKLLERVLSTFLLGLYTRGVFSVGQVNQLATICNTQDSTEFCQRVSDLSLIKRALPALFG